MNVIEEALKRIDDRVEFYRWAKSLDEADRKVLLSGVQDFPTVAPAPGPQTMAFVSQATVLGFGGAAGGGKAQPLDAEVQTPYGPKRMGDIRVGDVICDPFAKTQTVRSIQDFDKWHVMRVVFDDGTCIDCSPEHEWFGVWEEDRERLNSRLNIMGNGISSMETGSIYNEMREKGRKFLVPVSDAPIGNESKSNLVNPFVLATWMKFGALPIDGGRPRIVLNRKQIDIAMEFRDQANEIIGIEERENGVVSISLPSGIYSDIIPFCNSHVAEDGYPVHRFSASVFNASLKWREKLLDAVLRVSGDPPDSMKDAFSNSRDSLIFARKKETIFDIVKLARATGAWAKIESEDEGEYPTALIKRTLKSDSPPRLVKEIKTIEMTDFYMNMRCINVSGKTKTYLTDNWTVTHNSALIALLSYLRHKKTVVFRADAKQLDNLIDDLELFAGSDKGLNMQRKRFSFHGNKEHFVEWGGIDDMTSVKKWRGRAHDLFAVDEATEVPIAVIRKLMAWMRTTTEGQRVRAIFTFNPPGLIDEVTGIIPEGRWVMDYFAPWIDENYKDPLNLGRANMGELRWFLRNSKGIEEEVIGEGPHEVEIAGKIEMVKAQSRTFIPSLFTDNPYLNESYGNDLSMLEEPDRSQLMRGTFTSDIADSPYRVFPTKWVEEAMERWEEKENPPPISAIGCDVSRDGADRTCIARRHGLWFNRLIVPPKVPNEIFDGDAVARHCFNALRSQDVEAEINIDVIGIGASPFDSLRRHFARVNGVDSSKVNTPRLPGRFQPFNIRAYLHWLLRNLLDPKYGFNIALPKDEILRTEMLSLYYYDPEQKKGKIQIEAKQDLRKRIRRSPDRLDAVTLSLFTFRHEPEYDRLLSTGRIGEERQFAESEDPVPLGEMDMRTAIEMKEFYRQRAGMGGRSNSWMGNL